jgi:hypothetical protein
LLRSYSVVGKARIEHRDNVLEVIAAR